MDRQAMAHKIAQGCVVCGERDLDKLLIGRGPLDLVQRAKRHGSSARWSVRDIERLVVMGEVRCLSCAGIDADTVDEIGDCSWW